MTDRPILFSGDMVRAILRGAKTQTRRPLKPQPFTTDEGVLMWPHRGDATGLLDPIGSPHPDWLLRSPFGAPCDRLYVRETFADVSGPEAAYAYRADFGQRDLKTIGKVWTPSIHMPRAAARIWLRVDRVWVERVQGISEGNAEAEGAAKMKEDHIGWHSYRRGFQTLWDSVYGGKFDHDACEHTGPLRWDENPWVWACSFTVLSTTGEPR